MGWNLPEHAVGLQADAIGEQHVEADVIGEQQLKQT